MKFDDRYAAAISATNLKGEAETTFAPTDLLGAAAYASRDNATTGRVGTPLGMALMRLFVGDNRAAQTIVAILSDLAWGRARLLEVKIKRTQADDLARAVLAWHRDGVCRPCGGLGYAVIRNGARSVVSDSECAQCRGTARLLFDLQFAPAWLELARWLQSQIEREQAVAGQAAMAALAPRLAL